MSRTSSLEHAYRDYSPWLCGREALEASMPQDREELEADLSLWRTLIALAEIDPEPGRIFARIGKVNRRDPVEGDDWMRWALWVEERLAEAAADLSTVHPELDLYWDQPWRLGTGVPPLSAAPVEDAVRRWPVAAGGFSGFFGPQWSDFDPEWQQHYLLTSHSADWRSRLADECDELVELEDEVLRATVVALGSTLVPVAPRLRSWLTWMAWRIRTFRWPSPEWSDDVAADG